MADDKCPECGAPVVDGRLNCAECGATYPDAGERKFDLDPRRQGD